MTPSEQKTFFLGREGVWWIADPQAVDNILNYHTASYETAFVALEFPGLIIDFDKLYPENKYRVLKNVAGLLSNYCENPDNSQLKQELKEQLKNSINEAFKEQGE
jgi:hypothetical protein